MIAKQFRDAAKMQGVKIERLQRTIEAGRVIAHVVGDLAACLLQGIKQFDRWFGINLIGRILFTQPTSQTSIGPFSNWNTCPQP